MFEIDEIKIEHSKKDVVTDNTQPVLSFSLRSDEDGCELSRAVVCVGDTKKEVTGQTGIVLDGLELKPFTEYTVKLTAFDNMGRSASKEAHFSTGRLSVPWTAKWITDKIYSFAKNTSPDPFTFRKSFSVKKPLKRAFVTATALGIYELNINGKKSETNTLRPDSRATSTPCNIIYTISVICLPPKTQSLPLSAADGLSDGSHIRAKAASPATVRLSSWSCFSNIETAQQRR